MSSDTGKFYTNYSFEYPNDNVRVVTSSFQDVPSNKNPLINLTMNGILGPSDKLHVIKMKFEGEIPQKDKIAQSYGTFVLCKDVYNARKVIKTAWDKETDTLTIIIDLRKYNIRPKRQAQFSFSIQINDSVSCYKPCTSMKKKFGDNIKIYNCDSQANSCTFTKGCNECYTCSGLGCKNGVCKGNCTCKGYAKCTKG